MLHHVKAHHRVLLEATERGENPRNRATNEELTVAFIK
jgi:hypothetical protein